MFGGSINRTQWSVAEARLPCIASFAKNFSLYPQWSRYLLLPCADLAEACSRLVRADLAEARSRLVRPLLLLS